MIKRLIQQLMRGPENPANKPKSDQDLCNEIMDIRLRQFRDFHSGSFDHGFLPRHAKPKANRRVIERVINSYQKSKKDQIEAGSLFAENNEWTPIYREHLAPVKQALLNGDIDAITDSYENFYRDSCSTGLVGLPLDMQKHYFTDNIKLEDKLVALRDGFWRLKLWQALAGRQPSSDELLSPDIGNPYGFQFEGKFIRAGADYQHHYARQILEILKTCNQQTVLEIGGGFGGMAYFLLRDSRRPICYINIDLPENAALSAFYLLSAFPDRKIALYGELQSSEDIDTYEAVILPSFSIKYLRSESAGVAFNSYSLAEMSNETIGCYLNEVARIVTDYILHVNHTVNAAVTAEDFGIEERGFARLYKAPALWNLGRNIDMDEFEYLYKKL